MGPILAHPVYNVTDYVGRVIPRLADVIAERVRPGRGNMHRGEVIPCNMTMCMHGLYLAR